MTRFRMYSVLLILIAGIAGGCAPDSKPQHKAEEQDQRAILNEGYSLLYHDISNISRIHLIFLVKTESDTVQERAIISQGAQEKLLADIDAQLLRLESGETNASGETKPET